MSKSRKQANRPLKQAILIMCEGETEAIYFRDMRDDLGLKNVIVEYGNSRHCFGNDPSQILEYALYNRYRYEKIFCTFDKDNHAKYSSTLDRIHKLDQNRGDKAGIKAINSVPCFEYWLLLHFCSGSSPSTKPMTQVEAKKAIKLHIPSYKGAMNGLWGITKPRLDIALRNARLVAKNDNVSDNPSTRVHELIQDLRCCVC
ncbi:MAG: RloB family protein [Gammaproteobacteria bacterium]